MAKILYGEVSKDETIVIGDDSDEGCVVDIEAQGLSAGAPVKNDGLPVTLLSTKSPPSAKDSGLSSRMSDDGDRNRRSLLDGRDEKHLAKRLTWISEYQNDAGCHCKWTAALKATAKVICVFCLLYFFICTLDLLSNAFRLLGGKTAGSVFSDSQLLANPITGLMIGVLATVILQSSSTSSSIVITMVASKIIDIRPAIPIIMGANIGTTVTNTLVSLAHSMDRKEFKRAFSGAVVHDVFNWLTVLILLPLEFSTGYLYHLTKAIISSMNLEEMKTKKMDLLKKLTKPLTSRIVMVDKKVITGIAEGKEGYANKSLLKVYCVFTKEQQFQLVNETTKDNVTGAVTGWQMVNQSVEVKVPAEKCESLLSSLEWGDTTSGLVLFFASILLLSCCLYCMVKTLHSLLGGHIAKAARKTINADFPHPFSWLTGYVAIVVGAGMTILVQSSSVFTSALTPLVGIGCLKLERMFPLTLGSNIGTTGTGILAALASSSTTMHIALQLAFCHLFFNITGILLFYPVPKMRKFVLNVAKFLGRTTARYRWFAIAYLLGMFLVFPGFFFLLSFAGKIGFLIGLLILATLVIMVVVINFMQNSQTLSNFLPSWLRTWQILPEPLRSLAPYDRCLSRMTEPLSRCCCQCCLDKCSCLKPMDEDFDMGTIDSDDDDDDDDSRGTSVQSSYLPSVVSSKAALNTSASSHSFGVAESKRIYKGSNSRTPNSKRGSLTQEADPNKMPLITTSDSSSQRKVNFFIEDDSDSNSNKENILVIDMQNVKESDI